ncbi:ankyrin repeat-containing domain protein [Lasiosphaeris hirsuta]|uniref:Ankyrin repeat-containing domain protein n=1 Tax=Lasiosphaeris hirsuta TaxID=260670 RepID=A0AA40AG62_9PEZI|nr:ankyrin repeat-containing domain protein [Lasiosphaeris hirsuta]
MAIEYGREKIIDILSKLFTESEQEVVKLLLERGAKPESFDKRGRTPLHVAAKEGGPEVVQILRFATPRGFLLRPISLLIATMGNMDNESTLATLRDNDLIRQPDAEGWTAIHLTARVGDTNAIKVLAMVGCRVNAQNNGGETALVLATQNGNVESATELLGWNADLTLRNLIDQTVLMMAAVQGNTDIIKVLLKKQ